MPIPNTIKDLEVRLYTSIRGAITPHRWSTGRTGVHNDGVVEILICEVALVVIVGRGGA